MLKNLITITLILLLSSCSMLQIRKPPIEQGNIITPEMVSQLHRGMSPPQVIEVMGAPILKNDLTPNRLEYVYTYQYGHSKRTEKRVSCVFQNGQLKEILQS